MTSKIDSVLETLLNANSLPSKASLAEFSDLDQVEIKYLQSKWDQIPIGLRRSLIEELGKLGDDNVTFNFERINRLALNDEDEEVRRKSISNLWESEDPNLVQPLIKKLIQDPSVHVRAAAASALSAFVLLGETQGLPSNHLTRIEEALLDTHRNTKDNSIHRKSLESLGYSSRSEVDDLIQAAFESSDEMLVRSAILAMGRSANKKWDESVLSQLQSPSPELRHVSVIAVGELEIKEALEEIIDLVEDVNHNVHRAVLWSLSQLGGTRAADFLADLYNAAEEGDELELLEDAIDNLAFINGSRDILLFDDEEESIN